MYANFEEPRSRDRDLETLNLRKNCQFCLENNVNSLIAINLLKRGTLKFEYIGCR